MSVKVPSLKSPVEQDDSAQGDLHCLLVPASLRGAACHGEFCKTGIFMLLARGQWQWSQVVPHIYLLLQAHGLAGLRYMRHCKVPPLFSVVV